jgi:hypothetical protein
MKPINHQANAKASTSVYIQKQKLPLSHVPQYQPAVLPRHPTPHFQRWVETERE